MSKSKLILADMGYISPPAEIPYNHVIAAMHTYAAGFAEWKDRYCIKDWRNPNNWICTMLDHLHGSYTTAQLMEIYDGEK